MTKPNFHILRSGYTEYANPCHNPAGPGGGQFCGGESSSRFSSQNDWANSLSEEQKDHIYEWESDIPTVIDIRNYQAGKETIYEVESAVEKRINVLDSAFNRAPNYEGEVYRGLKGDFWNWHRGDEITFDAYSSSSKNFDTAKFFAKSKLNIEDGVLEDWKGKSAVLVLKVKSAIDIAPVTSIPEQAEVIIRPGTKFRLTKVATVPREYTGKYAMRKLTLEEI